jgi:hypothetical protein
LSCLGRNDTIIVKSAVRLVSFRQDKDKIETRKRDADKARSKFSYGFKTEALRLVWAPGVTIALAAF